MNRILEIIKELKQDYNDGSNLYDISLLDELEKEVKEYQNMTKHYGWNTIIGEICDVKTPNKYRDLFFSAILDVQKDYRKARAFEIAEQKNVNFKILSSCEYAVDYNHYIYDADRHLTQEEFDTIQRGIE